MLSYFTVQEHFSCVAAGAPRKSTFRQTSWTMGTIQSRLGLLDRRRRMPVDSTHLVVCRKRQRQSFKASVCAPSWGQCRTSTNRDTSNFFRTFLDLSEEPLSYKYTCKVQRFLLLRISLSFAIFKIVIDCKTKYISMCESVGEGVFNVAHYITDFDGVERSLRTRISRQWA